MKGMLSAGVSTFLFSPLVFSAAVSMSGPIPSISSSYGAGMTNTVIYTLSSNLPTTSPLSISGISGAVTRTSVANDCGNQLPAGPSTCNIGIAITPTALQVDSSISQTLSVSVPGNGNKQLTSTIAFTVSKAFAYVANYYNNSVAICKVNPITGLFNAGICQDSGAGTIFSGPVDILVRSFGRNKFAYVSNFNGNSITKCTINPTTGQLSSCGNAGGGIQLQSNFGMAFYNTSNGKTYLYVANSGTNQIYQCPVNANNGSLGTCVDSDAGPVFPGNFYINASTHMAFNTLGQKTYVYVAEGNNGSTYVTQCLVDSSTGKFSNCTNLNVGYPVSGITFTQSENQSIGYLVDFYYGNLFTCSVDNQSGSLNCGNPIPGGWWGQLTLATIGGQPLLYSANGFGSGTVSQCLIDPQTGTLSGCQDSGVGLTPFSAPFALAFT